MRAVTKFIHNKTCNKQALAMSCQQALFTQTVRACAFFLSFCCSLFNQVMRGLSVHLLRAFSFRYVMLDKGDFSSQCGRI